MQNVGRYADILFRAVCNYDKNMVYSQMGEEFTKYSKENREERIKSDGRY